MKLSLLITTVLLSTLSEAHSAQEAFSNMLQIDKSSNQPGTPNSAHFEPGVPSLAPLYANDRDHVPDTYIVTLKDIDTFAFEAHLEWLKLLPNELLGVTKIFQINSYKAYVGQFSQSMVDLIRKHPHVTIIERDSYVHAYSEETDAPWGLARVSHREKLNLGSFNKYLYDSEGGEGVTAYVIDTGVFTGHDDFEGRATWGKTVPQGDVDEDKNGHGTHCAGILGGAKYGISKRVEIVAVKVLASDGSGTMSNVIEGVVFAAHRHDEKVIKPPKGWKGSVANMSLGGGFSPSLNLAVNSAVDSGVHFAVAAGNDNSDACEYSPASSENAITVGASTLSDSRAYFSNKGKCVDVFAPGLNILSTFIGADNAVATLSGTSMASPHVAGLLAYFLSLQPDKDSAFAMEVTPKQLKNRILKYASEGILSDVDEDTPNLLVYNGGGKSLNKFWGEGLEVMTYIRKVILWNWY